MLKFLIETWGNMSRYLKFSGELGSAIESGIENLEKWYKRTDDTDVYFVCLGEFIDSELILC